jgi:hypothetical protein
MSDIDDSWLKTWATRCGIMLIVGFLLPFGGWIWFWNMMNSSTWLMVLIPLAAGIAALVLKEKLDGNQLAISLLAVSGIALLLSMSGGSSMSMRGAGPMSMAGGGGGVGTLLLVLSACSIAVGNHLSKTHTSDQYPKLMVGVGGIVLVALFIIPIGGVAPIKMFFTGFMWSKAWFILIIFAAVLAYGVVAILQFLNTQMGIKVPVLEGDQSELLSLLARVLLFGIPAIGVLGALFGPFPFFGTLLTVIKMTLLVYGALLLLVSSLTAVIEYNVGSGSQQAASE